MSKESHNTSKPKTSLSAKLACAATAGIIGTTIIYPLDIIKTRLQNQSKASASTVQYKGGVDCFKTIVRTEGWRGLYRGLLPNLIGITPEKAIKLAVNDYAREHLANWYNERNHTNYDADNIPIPLGMIAGATAGFCQVIATNPMEITKIQLQLASLNTPPGQPKPSLGTVVKDLGLKGMYRGTRATLLRDVPFSFIFFPLHAYFKMLLADQNGNVTFPKVFASGIVSGIIGAGSVTPMDVIKTRLQVKPKPGAPVYTGIMQCFRYIVQNEGPKALFKGIIPRCMIISPLFGITLLIYEFQQRYLAGLG